MTLDFSLSSPESRAPRSDETYQMPGGHPAKQLMQLPATWWESLRQILEFETGMDLSGSRGGRLRDAVAKIFRKSNRFTAESLENTETHARFVEHLAAELTVGESFFLRNENQMRLLRQKILPSILQDNQQRHEIRIWSAGCAGGEEPYSMAILLHELLGSAGDWNVSILGTDLNPVFLERARAARYRPWSFRQTTIHEDSRFFTPVSGGYQVCEPLRRQVRFGYLNLMKDIYPSGLNGTLGQDLILFRNVAIYLKPEVTRQILKRLYQALRPGGWLLLGEIEVALVPDLGFEIHRFPQATFHRKPLETNPASVSSTAIPLGPAAGTDLPIRQTPPIRQAPPMMGPSGSPLLVVPPLPEWVPLPAVQQRAREESRVNESHSQIPALVASASWQTQIRQATDPVQRAALRLRLAQSFLELARTQEAREELERSLRENPLSIEAHLLLAGLFEDLGQLPQAERSYRRALYLDRDCALAHFHLGLVLQQQGDPLTGWKCMQTALQLIETQDSQALVEHGDGVCYGRLREMIMMLTGDIHE